MEGSMAKVTVDIPLERLSIAQEYDIDLSDACTRAIERELRERAPLMNLTPEARSLLFRAQREAETREHATIRTEHIVLAILADDSIPGQLMRRLGSPNRSLMPLRRRCGVWDTIPRAIALRTRTPTRSASCT